LSQRHRLRVTARGLRVAGYGLRVPGPRGRGWLSGNQDDRRQKAKRFTIKRRNLELQPIGHNRVTFPMKRSELRSALLSLDLSSRPEEAIYRKRMLELLDSEANCFHRDQFPAHFTGSAFVVSTDGGHGLLHHHRKLDRWLQFGGHCDGEEDVLAVAQREAYEESGIDGLTAASSHPFDLDIHEIPAIGNEPPHLHYDVRYVLIAPAQARIQTSSESKELRWFSGEEMKAWDLDPGLRRLIEKWQSIRL
jgi:8-oxo-dGTP pyrophosphatase MutT (NUDIX family)